MDKKILKTKVNLRDVVSKIDLNIDGVKLIMLENDPNEWFANLLSKEIQAMIYAKNAINAMRIYKDVYDVQEILTVIQISNVVNVQMTEREFKYYNYGLITTRECIVSVAKEKNENTYGGRFKKMLKEFFS